MKIAFFVGADTKFPYTPGQVYAPLDSAVTVIEGLVEKGVDVTWYAPEGTKSTARVITKGIRAANDTPGWDEFTQKKKHQFSDLLNTAFLSHIASEYEKYDIINLSTFFHALSFSRVMPNRPVFIVLHNPLTKNHVQKNFDLYKNVKNII